MNKVVFLDRDGTINVDKGFVYKVEDWEWHERAKEALKNLQDEGFKLAIVTNQSGIYHGKYTEADVERVHDNMIKELDEVGVRLAAIEYCRDDRGGDSDCPKPNTGMARAVEQKIGEIDYTKSWMVGDKLTDLGFGKNLGAKVALIRSSFWTDNELSENKPDLIVGSLVEAADKIVSND